MAITCAWTTNTLPDHDNNQWVNRQTGEILRFEGRNQAVQSMELLVGNGS